jgi:LEA14-like dessication related protein
MKLRALMASLALVLAAGCALVPKFKEPHLEVVNVEMLKGDLLRQELRVRMRVQNPNDRALPVKSIEYQVEVAGEAFAHGESERDFVVPANGEKEFDVSVTANAASALLRMLGGGKKLEVVEYRITGKVALASGLMRNVPFSQKGEFKLR